MPVNKTVPIAPTRAMPNPNGLDDLLQMAGQPLPPEVLADLRTDQAGEVGAVCIYKGVLMFTRDGALREFAKRHLATEQQHLERIQAWLPAAHYSRLLPVWRIAGFLTGALPAIWGPRAVYATIESVETFVDRHYAAQIQALTAQPRLWSLRQTLQACQADEIQHRVEAAGAHDAAQMGGLLRLWCATVAWGSRRAVAVCRHI